MESPVFNSISQYKIFEGFDHFNNKPIYQVIGVNNEYVGEWYHSKSVAVNEMYELVYSHFGMTVSRALQFKKVISRRLSANGIDPSEFTKAIQSLKKCVMNQVLIKAYKVLTSVNKV